MAAIGVVGVVAPWQNTQEKVESPKPPRAVALQVVIWLYNLQETNIKDVEKLQTDLDRLGDWAEGNENKPE